MGGVCNPGTEKSTEKPTEIGSKEKQTVVTELKGEAIVRNLVFVKFGDSGKGKSR